MKVNIGKVTLSIDDKTGLADVLFNGKVRLSTVDFGLCYEDLWWGFTAGNVNFEGTETVDGADDYGNYKDLICLYSFTTEDGETVRVKKIARVYEKRPAIHFRIETSCGKPKFSDATGAIGILGVPNFEAGVCSHNGHPDPEIMRELFKSIHFSEEEVKKLLESMSADLLAEHAATKPETEFNYDCWAYPSFLQDWQETPQFGVYLLLSYSDNVFAALVPVNCYGQKSYIRGGKFLKSETSIRLWSGGYDNTKIYNIVPAGIVYFGQDPYESTKEAYECALIVMSRPTVARTRKPYPEIFEYLGWCSWNAYTFKVSEKDILFAAEEFKKKNIPVKFLIIDAGWLSEENNRLTRMEPNEKFPSGFNVLSHRLKRDFNIKYVGIWHTLQGYWAGVSPQSNLYEEYKEYIFQGSDGRFIPNPEDMKAFKFYFDWHQKMRNWGIDFTKVDNQYDIVRYSRNQIPLNDAAKNLLYALQCASNGRLAPILNCMSMVPECFYHWMGSNIARTSMDYIPNWKHGAKLHITFCAYNSLWFSHLTYPDYDMFQSYDPVAVPHALARAISGGPIYITDDPARTETGLVRRLSFKSGLVPRPDAPALPTRDCLFKNPIETTHPLKLFAKVCETGLLAVFNLNKNGEEETVDVKPADIALEGSEKYAVYRYFSDDLKVVSQNEAIKMKLGELGCELFIIAPVKSGFAPIGLTNVYIAPKGVSSTRIVNENIMVDLVEEGLFTAYIDAENLEVYVDNLKSQRVEGKTEKANTFALKDGLLKINCGGKSVRILRAVHG